VGKGKMMKAGPADVKKAAERGIQTSMSKGGGVTMVDPITKKATVTDVGMRQMAREVAERKPRTPMDREQSPKAAPQQAKSQKAVASNKRPYRR